MHERHCAVPQTVHLVEAARFEPARHQEDVRSRFNSMGEALVVADPRGDASGRPVRHRTEPSARSASRRRRGRRTGRGPRAVDPESWRSDRILSDRSCGRPSHTGARRPRIPDRTRFCKARLHSALPCSRVSRSYRAGSSGSPAGFHSSASIPFRIPTRSVPRDVSTPSSPHPYSGVVISRA